jgi:hypothetical protein
MLPACHSGASVRLFIYPTMTSWHIVYETWTSHVVPEVSIMPYKNDLHRFASPWWSVKHDEQARYSESPYNDTACHLASVLPHQPIELIAAYKLYAFLRLVGAAHTMAEILSEPHKKYGFSLHQWWHSNAKNVLPFTEGAPENEFTISRSNNWETLVNCAAIKWTQIALEWKVICLPSFMDPDSDERREYEKLAHKMFEQHERNEYLRLMKKFGDSL